MYIFKCSGPGRIYLTQFETKNKNKQKQKQKKKKKKKNIIEWKENTLNHKAVLEPRISPALVITYLCNHCNIRFDPIPVKVRKRSLTPEWSLNPRLLRSYVWLYPRIIVSKSHENTSKYVDTVTLFAKTWTKGHWPLDDLGPHICWGLMCDSTEGSLCPSPMKIHQSMWIQWSILQNTSTKGHWPLNNLWPHICWDHMCLYPRIIVSKSHDNTSKYVDTMTLFAKTWTKGHWPLDDLWPHICWGHMCDCTQGSLCPSPMGIHQCMWIQWSILKITNQRSLTPRWPMTHICWGLMCHSTQGSLCPSPMKIHQSMWIKWPFLQKTWTKGH